MPTDYPDVCVHAAFERQAALTPGAVAAVEGDTRATFAEVNGRANQLAYALRRIGVGPDRRVGLLLEPSVDLLVAMLGVLKAGGAFVPIDPQSPFERRLFLLQDAGAVCVLTQRVWCAALSGAGLQAIALDEEWHAAARQSLENPGYAIEPEHLAYVIYTSGSTGRPKGVMVSHAALTRYLRWCHQEYRTGGTGAPVHSSVAADLAITSLLAPLMAGEPVVLLPALNGLAPLAAELRARRDFSFVKLTPTHVRLLARELDGDAAADGTRALIVGGEALYGEDLQFWRTHAPDMRVINEYGPTETVVGCCVFSARAGDVGPGAVPIGRPLSYAALYVRDAHLQPVAAGATGDLYIGGAAMARGYLGRPDLTADRFVPDPFGPEPGARLYRTGDLARQRSDGMLEFVGRRDSQVKLHGYRVELGEIEHVLAEHADVEGAVVAASSGTGDDRRLVAYVVLRPDRDRTIEDLRDHLTRRLPGYMVPAAFVLLDRFPLLPNGKVDRLSLPSPDDVRPAATSPYMHPRSMEEEILAGIWSQVLHVDRVGIDDNYFVLGGDSIRTLQVVSQAQERGLIFSLDDMFQYPTIRELAAAIRASGTTAAPSPLDAFALVQEADRQRMPAGVVDAYPLSLLQAGMIYHMELSPESSIYHDINSFHIRAPRDVNVLRASLEKLVARHPILRTAFDLTHFSEPLQLVHRQGVTVLDVVDLRDLSTSAQDAAIEEWFEEEKGRGFGWGALPLIRFCVHLRGADTWQFTLSFHHAILDGWSEATMLSEVFQHYQSVLQGRETPLDPPAIQYRDFVRLERATVQSRETQAFWDARLAGVGPQSAPRWRPAEPGKRLLHVYEVPIDDDVSDGVKRAAMLAAVPIKDVLLAAHMRVMSQIGGSPDVLTSVVSSGRPEHADGDRVLGLFINSLPLRLQVTGGTWLDLATATFEAEREALPHRRYPLAELKWREGGRVLPETLFYFTHFHVYEALQQFRDFELLGGTLYEQSSFGLNTNFRVDPFTGRIYVAIKYNGRQFPEEQIAQIGHYYRVALTEIARNPLGRYDRVDLMSPQERHGLLVEWNTPAQDTDPAGQSIVDVFEAQVDRTPHVAAAVDGPDTLTYADLDARANQLARHLRALGVTPEARVAVCLERSASLVVAVLGILKAGGAYVALDPDYPAERLAFLLDDSSAVAVITAQKLAPRLPPDRRRVLIDEDWPAIAQSPSERLDLAVTWERISSVIYTSGSTGQPKGVACLHRGVVTLLRDLTARYALEPGHRCSVWANVTFDGAVFELFSGLLGGGTLCFAPEAIRADGREMSRWLAAERIESAFGPPFMLGALNEWAGQHPGSLALKRLVLGVEPIDERLLVQIGERVPGLRIFNTYGPTETTVWSTLYDVAEASGRSGPTAVGRPIAQSRVFVLDPLLRPVPACVPGEIYIGGAGQARGYLNRPALTAERFVPDAWSGLPGERLYRTGDRGRINAEGMLEFLGRVDTQVKIRGYRIEPGEIEALIIQQQGVRRAVVLAREDRPGDKRLVAYVEREPGQAPTPRELREALKRRLPEFMVPAVFVFLAALPLTARGKVDRDALAASSASTPEVTASYAAPRTATEEMLAGIWSHVLQVDSIGIHDNFFELGGHSLLATQLVATVRDAFQVHLPLATLFDAPTIAELGEAVTRAVGAASGAAAYAPLPTLTPDPAHRYDPFPLTDVQQAYWIGRNSGFELGGMASHGYLEVDVQALDLAKLTRCIHALVARHDMLRAVVLDDGRQRVLRDVAPYEIETVDLRGRSAEETEACILQVRDRMSRGAFRTDEWPLFELRAHLLEGDRTRLHFSIDPLTTDADSWGLLNRELWQLYADPKTPLVPLEITFRDYVLGELAFRASDRYDASRAYWMTRIATLPPAPDLPMKALDGLVDRTFARETLELDADAWTRVKTRAARRGLTPSGVLFSAYVEVLAAWSASPRFTINVTTYGALPLHPQVRSLVGDFTSLTLVAVESTGASFEARARAIQRRFLEDLEHVHFSGIEVLRELARRRNDALRAAMPVVFTSTLPLHTRAGDRHPAPPVTLVTGITQTPQTVLDHQLSEVGGALTVRWDYLAAAFPPDLIRHMFEAYSELLTALAADEGVWSTSRPVVRLPATQGRVRAAANATAVPARAEALHAGLVRQIAGRPDAIAVITPARTLRYADVGRRAAALAAALRSHHVGPELVAVVMEKGWEQVVAVVGILEAGAAYLPIDAAWPQARQWDVLRRGQVRIAVTQRAVDARLAWPGGIERIVIDDDAGDGRVDPLTGTCAVPEAPAYVIFTSGSTGEPKGVVVDHAAAINTIHDVTRRWSIGPADRVFGISALSFDLSVYDIFGVLGAGGGLVLPAPDASRDPDAWLAQMAAEGVTLWNSVPALFEMAVAGAASRGTALPASLRLAMLSGDWIPLSLPARARALGPGLEVVSLGGATEAAIWSIAHPIEDVSPAWTSVPYGRPLANQTWRILNARGAPAPDWVPGDLYIGGAGLAQGYWREPARTAERFMPDPETGERVYRTGDRGRYWPDGTIEFLGRTDLQVKVQGHRIELGEIEATLAQHPAVARAAAVAVGPRDGPRRLIAYVVLADAREELNSEQRTLNSEPRTSNSEPNPEQEPGTRNLERGTSPVYDHLLAHLSAHLPDYMVPRTIVRLDTMPLTANGKVDRRALPVPEGAAQARPLSDEPYRAPETDVERRIAAIWQDLLDVDRVGLDDSFLMLGGYSLLAIQLIARLRQELDVQVPIRAVFESSTLEALAALVVQQQAARVSTADVEAILAEVEGLSIDDVRARLTLPD